MEDVRKFCQKRRFGLDIHCRISGRGRESHGMEEIEEINADKIILSKEWRRWTIRDFKMAHLTVGKVWYQRDHGEPWA